MDQFNNSDGDLAMAYSSGRLFGVVTAAAVVVLVAGCGGSSGGDNPSDIYGSGSVTGSSSAAGAANGTGTATSEAHGKTGSTGTGSTRTTGHGGTVQPGPGGTKVDGGGGDDGGGGGSTPTGTTTHTPTPSNCTESNSAGAHIEVCPGKSLSNGQQMRITGDHFKPNENLLYMECRYKGEDANNYGPNDCTVVLTNLGQSSTKSDSNGNVGPVYLNAAQHFKKVDCGQCMVTVAVPIQKSDADNPHALIYFG